MITYATLTQFRAHLSLPATASDPDEDVRLLRALRHATAHIDRYTTRRFAPLVQTRPYSFQSPYRLRLDFDLLALTGLTNGDGAAMDLDLLDLLPGGDGPRHAIIARLSSGQTFTYDTSPIHALHVQGIWGTHDAWSQAWRDSAEAVPAAGLAPDAATIPVTDVTGPDAAGIAPRFQPGQLLRIEEEYMHLVAVDDATNTLSVIRGVRGTTAAAHLADAPIAVYQPPQDVQALCLRWAAWLYQQVDAGIGGGADWLYPAELPADLQQLIAPLRRLRVA
jgi:hypothetical protein